MAGWLLSVFSAVIVVSVSALILPDGKMTKFAKPFISLVVIFIVISPLTDINKYFDIELLSNNTVIETDKEFLSRIASAKIDYYRENCVKIAEKNGINGSEILIEYSIDENGLPIISGANINLQNAVISAEDEHIVILQRLKKDITEYLSIDEARVKINE